MPGVRDEGMIESALDRPRQKWNYDAKTDLAALAAAYTFGIAKNHGFVDGNKRAAFITAYSFLGINGYDFDAPETEVVTFIESLASGQLTEAKLAEWFRAGMKPLG
jgi:death-on-curing protein